MFDSIAASPPSGREIKAFNAPNYELRRRNGGSRVNKKLLPY